MNKLEFVNHSCVIISNKNISLAMDPWIEGSVFNNSWNLLVKTPDYLIERLKKADYVWFSHEHPDHFNPKNLGIFSKKNKVRISIARAGNVIGGGDWSEDRLIPDCVRSWSKNKSVILRNPKSTRPWQHVMDVLYGYILLAINLKINADL